MLIDDAEQLAVEFFLYDISSAAEDSYDECAARTDPRAPFVQADVLPIRIGMRLDRLKKPTWAWLVGEAPRRFLDAIDPSWDLIELPDEQWPPVKEAMNRALYDFMGAGRAAPTATKFLHYKRRHLFPILDSAVLANTGLRIPEPTTSNIETTIERSRRNRAAKTADACEKVRAIGRRNVDVLRRIQHQLRERGKDRTLVRVLDALLWATHPASEPSHWGMLHWSRDGPVQHETTT